MEKKIPLKNKIYNYISRKIQNGEYMPNQKITEIEICKEMGVSRTPIREALIKLSADNLLERIPNKGFFVRDVDKSEKLETYELLAVLDGLAGFLAVNKLTAEDILHMEELVSKIDIAIKYHKYSEYAKLQNAFHDIYINKCGNTKLINTLNSLRYNFIPQTYISNDVEKLFEMLSHCNKEHWELIDCMRKRDAEGCEMLLKRHWKTLDPNMI